MVHNFLSLPLLTSIFVFNLTLAKPEFVDLPLSRRMSLIDLKGLFQVKAEGRSFEVFIKEEFYDRGIQPSSILKNESIYTLICDNKPYPRNTYDENFYLDKTPEERKTILSKFQALNVDILAKYDELHASAATQCLVEYAPNDENDVFFEELLDLIPLSQIATDEGSYMSTLERLLDYPNEGSKTSLKLKKIFERYPYIDPSLRYSFVAGKKLIIKGQSRSRFYPKSALEELEESLFYAQKAVSEEESKYFSLADISALRERCSMLEEIRKMLENQRETIQAGNELFDKQAEDVE